MNSNKIQILPNIDQAKKNLFVIQQFEIKYGFKDFDERNNFPYRNFFRFEMDFKIKIREASWFKI
jgi:hypothetical protein